MKASNTPHKAKSGSSTAGAIILILVIGVLAIVLGFAMYFDGGWDERTEIDNASFFDRKSQHKLLDLKGEWKFSIGDDPKRAEADFEDSGWAIVKVPNHWENEGYRDYDGYAWYRTHFSIDSSDTEKQFHLLLGRIDDVDEVFVNGQRIGGNGSFPPNYLTAWDQDRAYAIPSSTLSADSQNVIAVRVFDGTQAGGIVGNDIGLYTSSLPQPIINLQGLWKFQTGDQQSWKSPEVDDSSFAEILVPGRWEDHGYPNYDGYAWYRKHFRISTPINEETLVLLLGRIDDTDEVFLNGHSIGKTGNLQQSDRQSGIDHYRTQRHYEFPSSLIRDENTLCVRVHDSSGDGGIYEGPIGIMTQSDHVAYWNQLRASRRISLRSTYDWLMGNQ